MYGEINEWKKGTIWLYWTVQLNEIEYKDGLHWMQRSKLRISRVKE